MQVPVKNLLLVNPWIYDFTAFDLWSKPLGLLYIASFLRNHGFGISLIDCVNARQKNRKYGTGHIERITVPKPESIRHIPRNFARYGISESEFLEKLDKVPSPDAILVTSIMTYWYPGVVEAVRLLRKRFPGIPVILGGIYATLMPEHAQEAVQPDYIITGPGERKALTLLNQIFEIDQQNDPASPKTDARPFPAFDLYDSLEYLVLMTARGCPYDCSFCAQKKISEPFYQRNPEEVLDEIIRHYNSFKLRDIAFYDDALFINRDRHIKPILRQVIEKRIPVRFHSPNGLFARYIDQELADLMYRAKFKTVRISFETDNENRRRDMSNKISNEGMTEAVSNLVRAGYKAHELDAYVIMGLPGQSLDEVVSSMIFVNNLGVQIRLASFSPIPGTKDFDRAVASGRIAHNLDPLLTNKSIFPLHAGAEEYESFKKLRIFSQVLNNAAIKGLKPFSGTELGTVIRNELKE